MTKEERVPMIREINEAIKKHAPADTRFVLIVGDGDTAIIYDNQNYSVANLVRVLTDAAVNLTE